MRISLITKRAQDRLDFLPRSVGNFDFLSTGKINMQVLDVFLNLLFVDRAGFAGGRPHESKILDCRVDAIA